MVIYQRGCFENRKEIFPIKEGQGIEWMWKDLGRGTVCFHEEWGSVWNQHSQPMSNAGCSGGRMEGREDARGEVGSVLETLEVMPRV